MRGVLTYLLRQHIPLEFWEILHRPHIVSPPRTLLPPNWLRIQHIGYRPSNTLVLKFDPSLCVVSFLRRSVLSTEVRPFRV